MDPLESDTDQNLVGPYGRGMRETVKYLEEHGTANVPRAYVTNDGFKLGRWQTSTRYLWWTGKLSNKRTIALEKMGFDFSIGARSSTNHKKRDKCVL